MEKNKEVIIQEIKSLKTTESTQRLIKYIHNVLDVFKGTTSENQFLANIHNELALAYLHSDEMEKAEQSLLEACKLDSKNKNSLRNLANMYYQRADFDNALLYLSQAIEVMPENAELYYHKGMCFSSLGKPEKALDEFVKTCDLNNDFVGGFYWAGQCLLHGEKYEEALTYLEKAYDLDQGNEGILRSFAISLFNTKQYERTIEICDELTGIIGEDQVFAYKVKGDTYLELGQVQDAVKNHVILASIDRDLEDYPKKVIEKLKGDNSPLLAPYVKYIITLLPEFSNSYMEYLDS